MGCDPVPSVDDGGGGGHKLDGSDLERLSKGDRGQFHQAHIFLLMHNGGRLPGKVDACFPQQAELLEIIVKTLRSQPLSHVDEHRITGVHGSL